jgi:methyl-accepting chemotaxis protein
MTTSCSTGQSSTPDTLMAMAEAMRLATRGLGGPPHVGFIFAGSNHDLGQALDAARSQAPGCRFLGCHTSGEFTAVGLTRGGIAVMLIHCPDWSISASLARSTADPRAAATALADTYTTVSREAEQRGRGRSATVLLTDGLGGTGERVVKELLKATRITQTIVGGAAGDDAQFIRTPVALDGEVTGEGAAAVHFFGAQPFGIGIGHGLKACTATMTVTKAQGSRLDEIDGKPAFEAYQAFAARKGVTLTPENAGPFMIANELGVYLFDDLHHARAPVGVTPEGGLKLVADVQRGDRVAILDGAPSEMVAACAKAAADARAQLGGRPAAGVLVFDCVCRGMILGDRFHEEINAVSDVFPGVPVAGFLTYGEIARGRGTMDGWHNTTSVVLALPA